MNLFPSCLLLILFFLIKTTGADAQGLISIGPSVLVNVSFFDEVAYLGFGGDLSYEFSSGKNNSIQMAFLVHYSRHRNGISPLIKQEDLLIGGQVEYRFHLGERYYSRYIGVGWEVKHLTARNFFPPTPLDPEPILFNWEWSVGVSYGEYFKIDENLYFNPFVHLGINPGDQNEYEMNVRAGVCVGWFGKKKKE